MWLRCFAVQLAGCLLLHHEAMVTPAANIQAPLQEKDAIGKGRSSSDNKGVVSAKRRSPAFKCLAASCV